MLTHDLNIGGKSNTPGGVYYPSGISSLSNRPMEAPVKGKGKRPIESEKEELDPALKQKASPEKTSAKRVKRPKNGAEPENSKLLQGIVDGTLLPTTEAEATAAAEVSEDTRIERSPGV